MKTWQETTAVLSELAIRLAAGKPAAVATLVQIKGSSYRRPGAKVLVGANGDLIGNVSGGCLEEDLRERGLKCLQSGKTELIHYDTGADEDVMWGFGLGCNGKLDVWLQPFAPPAPQALEEALRKLNGDTPFALIQPLDRTPWRVEAATPGEGSSWTPDSFREVLEPPARLLLVGAGEDARPVCRLAAESGFRVTVVDHRRAYLTENRFPLAHRLVLARPEEGLPTAPSAAALVVLMTHSLKMDKAWAAYFAGTPVAYLGLLGPKARRDEIVEELPAEIRPRLYGPVGLDIGAEGAGQIAVSVVAELLAAQAGRCGGSLRDREKELHKD